MTEMHSGLNPDYAAAPDHLMRLVHGIAPQPHPDPTGSPTQEQWAWQVRRVADQIWREAWFSGAAHVVSTRPGQLVVCDLCGRDFAASAELKPAAEGQTEEGG